MATYRFLISGEVQGIGYRAWLRSTVASYQEVNGWVRNLSSGEVEAVIDGSDEQLAKLEELLYDGPAQANVTHVSREEYEGDPPEIGFQVLPDA